MNVSRDISEFSWRPFLVLLAWLILGLPSAAQVTSGTIEGTVTDSSGAPVPGVKITITNIQKNDVREYTTDVSTPSIRRTSASRTLPLARPRRDG